MKSKRHVRRVLVKIRKATNNLRKKHIDADFTFASKTFLQDIATLLGSESLFIPGLNPLRITVATRQAPLVMHIEYEVRLPDHEFVVASKHKLVPSVFAACEIQTASARCQPEISYTWPLYIAIRSLKHESITAFTHDRDFDHVLELEDFSSVAKNRDQVKLIVLAFVDGVPDENLRFPKVLSVAIDHFRKYKLDVHIAMTHAPGMSAYSYVECRMASLSKALAEVVLNHDACGTHLDESGRTIGVELEKENFRVAGKVLADTWSELELDERLVIAEYIENERCYPDDTDELWVSQRCRISQYMLQIVKRNDRDCWGEVRSV